MKKFMLLLTLGFSLAFAESCVLDTEITEPQEEKTYVLKYLCIDNYLYTTTFRKSENDFTDIQPAIFYRDGKPLQKTCVCPKVQMVEKLSLAK